MKRNIGCIVIAMLFLALALPVAARAQGSDEGWKFSVGTFLWANDTDVKLETDAGTIDSTAKFTDVVGSVVPTISITTSAKYDKLSFHINMLNIALKDDLASDLGGDRSVELTVRIPEGFVGYDVINTDINDNVSVRVEPYVGVRYFYSRFQIDRVNGGELRDVSKRWTDPVVGLLADFSFGEKFSVTLRGDIGGFGWGSSSEKDIFGLASFNWHYASNKTLRIGYADLKVEREGTGPLGKANTEFELYGPIFSHTYNF